MEPSILTSAETSVAAACRRPLTPAGVSIDRAPHSADDADGDAEVLRPVLPRPIRGERDAGQAPSQSQAYAVGEAEPRLVPVERRGQAGVEAAERADRDPEGLECDVHVVDPDACSSGLLERLGVVDRRGG